MRVGARNKGAPEGVPFRYEGVEYALKPGETVLSALLRQGAKPPYSCGKGVCLSCVMRASAGEIPPEAQAGLRPTLRSQGYFLACLCAPATAIDAAPAAAQLFRRARIASVERPSPAVARLRLVPAAALNYRAGQFLNLRRADGMTRSYSLASVPRRDPLLEIHVERLENGEMSGWIHDRLQTGDGIEIDGPNGACFYLPGKPEQPLLMIGTGTGLAPLFGIARDALLSGHKGPIRLYHGARERAGLYLHAQLLELARRHPNFAYRGCVSGEEAASDCRAGRASALALEDHKSLAGWRVFLCGAPPMVQETREAAYLAGAALEDILADPFELRDLRRVPRAPAGKEAAA